MAITITAEQYYKDGVAQTTPYVYGDNKYCWAGMSGTVRYATLYTCKTTVPISRLTLEITHAGQDSTNGTQYLGMYVTTAKNNTYLTSSTGGDTKLRFSYDCTDDGSFVSNGVTRLARGTVTKNIPAGTFYIYIVPYQTNVSNYCYIRSLQMTENVPTASGTNITIYKATLNNQSATTAGTAALWYPYNTYFSPYYYYTDSTCATGLKDRKITIPKKTGYTFGGYYTSTAGAGTQYITAAGVVSTSLYKVQQNLTLYAKWTAKSFTVTFNANGGTTSTDTKSVTYASTYGTLPTPTRTGYTFNGWYTAKTGGSKITSTSTVSITADQTLYAQWTAKTFKVTFNPNGGTTITSNKTVTYDAEYGTLPTPTRTGYTFDGWYTAASGGTEILATTTVAITAAQTLYAHWTGNQYTLTVDPNTGTYNDSETPTALSTKLQYGTDALSTIGLAVKSGYSLLGYFTAAEGGVMVYAADGTCVTGNAYWSDTGAYSFAGDLTVYAQWKADGLIYFDTGSEVLALQLHFDTGSEILMLAPYFDDGSAIHLLS